MVLLGLKGELDRRFANTAKVCKRCMSSLTLYSNLNRRRYAMNDETLYVARSDKRTDYSQPPMSNFYYGVLNTGRRRYAHPALSGSLPSPWLPAKAKPRAFGDGAAERRGVVLSLRRKMAKKLRMQQSDNEDGNEEVPEGWSSGGNLPFPENERRGSGSGSGSGRGDPASQMSSTSNPWRDPTPTPPPPRTNNVIRKTVSFDPASGVIALPEDNVWGDEGSEENSSDGDEVGVPESPVCSR